MPTAAWIDEGHLPAIELLLAAVAQPLIRPAVNDVQMHDLAAVERVPGQTGQRMRDAGGDECQLFVTAQKGAQLPGEFERAGKRLHGESQAFGFFQRQAGRGKNDGLKFVCQPFHGCQRHALRAVQIAAV